MKALCSKCGYPNEIKKVLFKNPVQRFTCTRCGMETELKTGTVGAAAPPGKEPGTDRRWFEARRRPPGRLESPRDLPESPRQEAPPPPWIARERDKGGRADQPGIRKKYRIFAIVVLLVFLGVALSTLANMYYRIRATEAVTTARTHVMESPDIELAAGTPSNVSLTQMQFAKGERGVERARMTMRVTGEDRTILVVVYLKKNGSWAVTDLRLVDRSGAERRLGAP